MGVGIHLDIGEQLWGVLHLVNQNRRLVQLQKQLRVIFCQRPLVQIIQRYIAAGTALHKLFQHGRFANLSRTRHKNDRVFLRDLLYDLFKTSSDIHGIIHRPYASANFPCNSILAEIVVTCKHIL